MIKKSHEIELTLQDLCEAINDHFNLSIEGTVDLYIQATSDKKLKTLSIKWSKGDENN